MNVGRHASLVVKYAQALSLVLLGVLFFPIAADAHAVLTASSPAAGQRIDATLRSVTLTFDEPVEAGLSSIRVIDSAGADRSAGPPSHSAAGVQTLSVRTTPLRHGHFVVAWRVVSADSHLVSGAFAFGVGEAAQEVPPVLAAAPESGLSLLLAGLHIGEIASLLTALGSTIASIAVPHCRVRLAPVERGAWLALGAIAFVAFFGQAEAIGVEPLRLLESRLGAFRMALVFGAVLGCVALRAGSRTLLVAAALMVTVGDVLCGHAVTGAQPALGIVVDSVHLIAAATWIGVLLAALGAPVAELGRIRAVAAASVLALTLTALPQAVRNIAAASDLRTTVYGRLVCVKAGLFCITLATAAVSWRRSRRRTPHIGASVRLELALLAGLTLVTGLLVDTTPPRSSVSQTARAAETSFRLADRRIAVSVSSTGEREYLVHIVITRFARPADVDDLGAWLRNREDGVGPLMVPLQRRDIGVYLGRTRLPFAGRWLVWVRARRGDFEEAQRALLLP